jgi:hypothetical protein
MNSVNFQKCLHSSRAWYSPAAFARRLLPGCLLLVGLSFLSQAPPVGAETNGVSATPAMGWSTWSFLRKSPTEAAVKAQALALHNSGLQSHGFVYVNLDDFYYLNPATTVDAYGRWVPDPSTFPDGMAAVAAYVHGLGLKFGIYVTAGIPVAAYNQNTPIQGTTYHAKDIVSTTGSFEINYNVKHCMYHIDYSKPGAQAFINSWANLYASWGVDYLKIDGVGDWDIDDIAAWSQALIQTGRPIHFELSNGLDVNNGSIWRAYANGWRITGDIECYCSSTSYPLTDWANVAARFSEAPLWTQYGGPGGWNDLDSIEIGNGSNDGLTSVQKQAAMTLWCICCAPLIMGTDLTQLNSNDLPLLGNNNVLQIDQAGSIGAPLTYNTTTQVWRAAEADGSYAVAFFNLGSSATNVSVTWAQLGFANAAEVHDLWAGTDLGSQATGYSASVPADGATFYRIIPANPAFRYLANAPANVIGGGAYLTNSPELSGGVKAVYVGMGGTVTFNHVVVPTAGAYNVTFLYENGGASRNANISVNGSNTMAVAFGGSGSWTTLASKTIAVTLPAGSNSIAIANPTAYAPDFDSLVVQSTGSNASPITSGTYKLLNLASGKYLDNLGVSSNGAPVGQWSSSASANQQWAVSLQSDGSYKVSCLTGVLYLDSLGNTTNGAPVGQWSSSASNNQQWNIVADGSYYKLINVANNLRLDTLGSTANGAAMGMSSDSASGNEEWLFTSP